jgi:hypothetical protein
MNRAPTAAVAAGSLVAGFGVAELTGVRPIGGLVLLAGLAWCVPRWRERTGDRAALGLVVAYAAVFAGSHLLGLAIGAWPAVAVAAAVMGAAAYVVSDTTEKPIPAR